MGAPIGNRNAAGPRTGRSKTKKTSPRPKYFTRGKHHYTTLSSRFGKRIGSPAEGYRYRTPADF